MITASVVCSSFKQELLKGVHDFLNDSFKIALYAAAASLDSNTTAYTTQNEVVGIGYTAAGVTLANAQVLMDAASRVAYATFDNPTWADSVITARGALIYNQTKQQRAVAVLDFGADYSSNHGPFTV